MNPLTPTTPDLPTDIRALFHAYHGYLTAAEAHRHGIHSERLARLAARGAIERVQRGVYRLNDDTIPFGAAEELLELQLRTPYARPCLITALHLHGLTTTHPASIELAIPSNRTLPHLEATRATAYYFGPRAYAYGVLEVPVAGRTLTTYTAEKTLADLLRYAPKLGRDVYLEGLKNYLRLHPHGARALLDAARAMRVETAMRRDLEVLTHEPAR